MGVFPQQYIPVLNTVFDFQETCSRGQMNECIAIDVQSAHHLNNSILMKT